MTDALPSHPLPESRPDVPHDQRGHPLTVGNLLGRLPVDGSFRSRDPKGSLLPFANVTSARSQARTL